MKSKEAILKRAERLREAADSWEALANNLPKDTPKEVDDNLWQFVLRLPPQI